MSVFIAVMAMAVGYLYFFILGAIYYLVPPYIMYKLSWQSQRLKKYHSALLAIFTSYVIENTVHILSSEDWKAFFNNFELPTQEQFILSVGNHGDHIFWLFLGWIPITFYVLFCWLLLQILRKRDVI